MAIIVTFDLPGATRAQYEEVTNRLTGGRGLVRARSDWPVPGLISHTAGPSDTGWFVCDVWESEEAFQRFGEVLMPIMKEAGMPAGSPVIRAEFNTVTS